MESKNIFHENLVEVRSFDHKDPDPQHCMSLMDWGLDSISNSPIVSQIRKSDIRDSDSTIAEKITVRYSDNLVCLFVQYSM